MEGVSESLFVIAVVDPDLAVLTRSLGGQSSPRHSFGTLLAATVGAVIMPSMVFYQHEAVIDKGYRARGERGIAEARRNTMIGAIITPLMMAIVAVPGTTLGAVHVGRPLNDVGAISAALTPFLGRQAAEVFFGLGMVGASVVAALVVSVAGAWGIAEVFGCQHSLNDRLRSAKGFYGVAVLGLLASASVVIAVTNLVGLAVDVEVMNAALLPVVLTFHVLLERRLPAGRHMRGPRRAVTYVLVAIFVAVGLVTIVTMANAAT